MGSQNSPDHHITRSPNRPVTVWLLPYLIVVVGFFGAVSRYYRPGQGFTVFLTLPASSHEDELPAVRDTPHYDDPTNGYDGQFYSQLAVEPLLRDPAIDRALDSPPYRARRILFSWTAFVIGLGRPAWVLSVFALQNVAAWLVLSWLLTRWFPIGTPRAFFLWSACVLTHGVLSSVRYALVDVPCLVLLALAVAAAEAGRPWVAAVVLGLAGLARETTVVAVTLFAGFVNRSPRSWLVVGGCLAIAVLPLLLWIDYLRSIYLSSALSGGNNIVVPFTGLAAKARETLGDLQHRRWSPLTIGSACAIVAFVVQSSYVAWLAVRRRERSPWLGMALSFAALGIVSHYLIWAGSPGAITRAALPLTIGFNVLARRASWPVLVAGNLTVIPGVWAFAFQT